MIIGVVIAIYSIDKISIVLLAIGLRWQWSHTNTKMLDWSSKRHEREKTFIAFETSSSTMNS